jgi:hypothetical protein
MESLLRTGLVVLYVCLVVAFVALIGGALSPADDETLDPDAYGFLAVFTALGVVNAAIGFFQFGRAYGRGEEAGIQTLDVTRTAAMAVGSGVGFVLLLSPDSCVAIAGLIIAIGLLLAGALWLGARVSRGRGGGGDESASCTSSPTPPI